MAELPIMPVKTDALISDTTHLSAEQFGVYWRLLCALWRHGGIMSSDDRQMAAIGGVSLGVWKKMKPVVMAPFTVIDGTVSQKRLTTTWQDVQEVRAKRADAAARRWGSKTDAIGMQMHKPGTSRSNANQNQISKFLSSEQEPVREPPGGSLATARNERALRSPPVSEPEAKGNASEGSVSISPQLAAILATKS